MTICTRNQSCNLVFVFVPFVKNSQRERTKEGKRKGERYADESQNRISIETNKSTDSNLEVALNLIFFAEILTPTCFDHLTTLYSPDQLSFEIKPIAQQYIANPRENLFENWLRRDGRCSDEFR